MPSIDGAVKSCAVVMGRTIGARVWYVKAMAELDLGELSDDAIAGDFRVYQRVRGHRYSLDDVATAYTAARARPEARRLADLGCGLGSVTVMLAFRFPDASIEAIEAQAISHELARRNLERNGLASRVRLHHGDLRDAELPARLGAPFDLVTGTPPYFDPRKSSPSTDEQRTYARIEMRGGVEAYMGAGARLLGEEGRLVICGDAQSKERVVGEAPRLGLRVVAWCDVIPRLGKAALFTIWTLASREAMLSGAPTEEAPIIARDEQGGRTERAHELRRFFGLEPSLTEAPSPPRRARTGDSSR